MPESSADVLSQYIADTIAALDGFAHQLRSFASEGDDEEVQSLFARHAITVTRNGEALGRHQAARGRETGGKSVTDILAGVLSRSPRLAQIPHTAEERIVQNLIGAFALSQGQSAMYEAMAHVAGLAGDNLLVELASASKNEEQQAALQMLGFLPTRAKIAFNLLTATEVDPAVETKTSIDRLA